MQTAEDAEPRGVAKLLEKMKIKLHRGKKASEQAILALEAAMGCRLSDSFTTFLKTSDGAEPEPNRVSGKNLASVRRFIPINEVLEEREDIEDIPAKAYPVAYDGCGNYILINEDRNGAVFFWDHELSESTELAASFGACLDLLEPFDTSTVQLKPGQVKKVWIDPEFLKRIKK
jgi:hypothetical protein